MTSRLFRRSTFIALTGLLLLGLAAINPEPNLAAGLFHPQKASLIKAQSATTSTTTTSTTTTSTTTKTSTGNGAPSGPHYDLNIHGVVQGGSASTGSNGHDIFVPLQGKCQISLSPGAFQVLDPNCLDGSAAFQLPNPVSTTGTTSITTIYSVWIRALAKPGGSSTTTTCATDLSGVLVCSTSQYVLVQTRKNGQSVFTNATANLLFVSQCVNGTLTRTPLFATTLQNYFWEYDNTGMKLLQLRFYQVPTTVAASGSSC
jgi:hypothetical protein